MFFKRLRCLFYGHEKQIESEPLMKFKDEYEIRFLGALRYTRYIGIYICRHCGVLFYEVINILGDENDKSN